MAEKGAAGPRDGHEAGYRAGRRLHGRRKGPKLSARRQALLRTLLPQVSLTIEDRGPGAPLRVSPWPPFDPPLQELWLEIGFGKGENLARHAAARPDIGFLGCEPYLNGVAGLLTEIEERGLGNVRIYADDARDLLDALPEGALGRVFLLHPDPWPKTRHASRRFVNRQNLDALARVMAPGAELCIQTDHPGYVRWTMIQMADHNGFDWRAEGPADWRRRPADWPGTRYERKARGEGRPAVYLRFRKDDGTS